MKTVDKNKKCQYDLSPKDPVVISGISGRFPESENLDEFWQNLYNGVDMVTDDGRRWSPGTFDLPRRSGKLNSLDKFDAGFFGVHPKQANFMDPQLRMLMEVTYEAIVDAGVNPAKVRGTRTGVFIGASASESEKEWMKDSEESRHGYTLTGCNRGMFSNRISFAFDLQGPSFTVDTACSSSFIALEQAVSSIKLGHCDAAIVGGTHLCLEPEMSLQFNRLNMLSPEGKCKSFDADGNGYVRSEAVVAIFIQKKDVAQRSYASILAARTNTDGFKEKGVTFPSGDRQRALLEETYREAGVNPNDVVYVEAHGTGTPAGDPQELTAIAEVLCKNRDENSPLLIGSVKSNMGHSEPSSGLCGMAKVLLAFQKGVIPGNLHFQNPNPNIPPLIDGRLKVVSQNTPWEGGIVGLNSFGFGGANVHIILKSESKQFRDLISTSIVSEDRNRNKNKAGLPFIIPFSGCTKASVDLALKNIQNTLQDKINEHKTAACTTLLLHKIFQERIQKHQFRGFTLFHGKDKSFMDTMEISEKRTEENNSNKPSVWFIFNGMGSQWLGFAKDLFKFSAFKESIEKSSDTLLNNNINLKAILFNDDDKILDDVTNSFVIMTAVQIALVDLLSSLGIKPDGIVGHSVGELGAAYADGCLTLEQTILAALARGEAISASESSSDEKYGMAAVGLSWDETILKCPPNIYPACHNSKDSVTISGPLDAIQNFVDQLKKEEIFAKEVASSGRAFHSKYIEYAKPKLKILLDEIIPVGKAAVRSSRWKSTSVPESEWESDLAKTSSADYHVNNLISPVLFQEALCHIPESAVVLEIGPHCLLQAILKRSLPACSHIGLINKNSKDISISSFLCQALGKMYNCGLNPNFTPLYPPVEFPVPVSCCVPSLSSLFSMSWDHEKSWNVPIFDPLKRIESQNESTKSPGQTTFEISLEKEADKFYADHKIDGRIVFPATGYLCLIWKAFAQLQNKSFDQVPVVFENFKIERATVLQKTGTGNGTGNGNEKKLKVKFSITIFNTTGEFQLVEGGVLVVTGVVRSPKETEFVSLNGGGRNHQKSIPMNTGDAYKELRLRGYEYGEKFQGILKVDTLNCTAEVKWLDNWVTLLDTFLQVAILQKGTRALLLPSFIDKTVLDPQAFLQGQGQAEAEAEADDTDFNSRRISILYDDDLTTIACKGIQIQRWKTGMASKTKQGQISGSLKLERFHFTPYFDEIHDKNTENGDCDSGKVFSRELCLRTCVEIILENVQANTLKMVEIKISNCQKALDISDSLAQKIQYEVLQQPSKLFSGKIVVTGSPEKNDIENENASTCEQTDENQNIISHSEISVVTAENQKELEDEAEGADLIVMSYSNCSAGKFSSFKIENFLLVYNDQNPESVNIEKLEKDYGVILVAQKTSSFFLFRKRHFHQSTSKTVIQINLIPRKTETKDDFNYDWVETLKEAMRLDKELTRTSSSEKERRTYVVSWNSPESPSGTLGLVNSIIKEPGGANFRCFFLQRDSNLKLDFNNPDEFLAARLQQDLVFNIFDSDSSSNSNVWGSYRFFPLQSEGQPSLKKVDHGFINIRTKGDLSSFQWFESPLNYHEPQSDLCKVYYAALNFRDVMLCTGKLSPDSLPNNQGLQESVLGLEFSGETSTGNKIMGYLPTARAFATSVIPDLGFSWNLPDSWTLAEAATTPVVYSTAYYALLIRGKMREGESILIHSGAGGVGQAAISIALSMNCKVFTTVSSKEKRDFLQEKFPQLNSSSFASSRDSSFFSHVLKQTKGKGVDLVLNSLAGELLQASIKCLRQRGRFLEIGKVDLFNDSKLGMSILLKDVSVHGILLDSLESETLHQKKLWNLMDAGVKSGVIRPLAYTTFSDSTEDIERAFRFMASGKHKGKVLIKIHDENEKENGKSSPKMVEALPRSYFDPSKSFVIVGGLGGFGMELCGWLVERGVRKLALVSRSGVKNGFQDYQIRKWREQNGVSILISTVDVTTTDGAAALIQTVIDHFKSPVGGIFNLAMVLRDGFMENQAPENFQIVSKPKVNAAMALDRASRKLAPSLEYFVVFSSVASGQGSQGLANYAWANSASERICEERRKSGFPALAIMWGAIGDVGVLLEGMKMGIGTVVGGTTAQPISSCLKVLDLLLHEAKSPNSQILVSRVIADKTKKLKQNTEATSSGAKINLPDKVAHILGLKPEELKNVNVNTKLYEMGMDSLMQVEIKQLLEMYTGISYNPREMMELTFSKINDIQNRIDSEREDETLTVTQSSLPKLVGNFTTEENSTSDPKTIQLIVDDGEPKEPKMKFGPESPDEENPLNTKIQNISKMELEVELEEKDKDKESSISNEKTKKTIVTPKFKLGAAVSYLLAALTVFTVLTLSLFSLALRQLNHFYLKLFHDTTRIKIMTRPYDQICAANPRTSNQIQCLKFSGIPNHAKILKKLEENVVNWHTNILLENGQVKSCSEDSYYKPYELLSWKVKSGIFFDYWEKEEDFSTSNHLRFKTCPFISESALKSEALRLCGSYHNKKWSELKPQWEVCVLAPEYENEMELNYPPESREFYILVVAHHSFGDGFSFLNMLQFALRDRENKHEHKQITEPLPKNFQVAQHPLEKIEESASEAEAESLTFKLSLFIKSQLTRLHYLILETSRIDKICRDNSNFSGKLDSSRHCELRTFDLSSIKAVKNQRSGKRASVNAVILTCASRAYERIYKEYAAKNTNTNKNTNKNNSGNGRKNIKLPKNLVAMMPFACFQQEQLDMLNNFSHSYVAVPTNPEDIHIYINPQERLNLIQKEIEDSSTQEKLSTSWDIICILSSLAKPISRLTMPFLSSPSFVFTSVPAVVPKHSTYFGGYTVKEFFGYSMLVTRTHGALASAIDSVNDSVNLSYVVDETALDISPQFLDLFFNHFQDELDSLILAT